ncbi:hypothetical protein C8R43DRAFT_1118565 [Mycena crocata]|nr:hypothetical protein C8R43DRAFT_1118565 [Mycena crocata]
MTGLQYRPQQGKGRVWVIHVLDVDCPDVGAGTPPTGDKLVSLCAPWLSGFTPRLGKLADAEDLGDVVHVLPSLEEVRPAEDTVESWRLFKPVARDFGEDVPIEGPDKKHPQCIDGPSAGQYRLAVDLLVTKAESAAGRAATFAKLRVLPLIAFDWLLRLAAPEQEALPFPWADKPYEAVEQNPTSSPCRIASSAYGKQQRPREPLLDGPKYDRRDSRRGEDGRRGGALPALFFGLGDSPVPVLAGTSFYASTNTVAAKDLLGARSLLRRTSLPSSSTTATTRTSPPLIRLPSRLAMKKIGPSRPRAVAAAVYRGGSAFRQTWTTKGPPVYSQPQRLELLRR